MKSASVLLLITGAALGFSTGLLTERYLSSRTAVAGGSPSASAPAEERPAHHLTRAADFNAWLSNRSSLPLEPILHPADLAAAIYPCGQTPSPCSTQRNAFRVSLANLRNTPSAVRDVAWCFLDGCEGATAKLPANACLWWTFYTIRYADQKGALDERYRETACASARLGDSARQRSLANQWEREAIKVTQTNG